MNHKIASTFIDIAKCVGGANGRTLSINIDITLNCRAIESIATNRNNIFSSNCEGFCRRTTFKCPSVYTLHMITDIDFPCR